MNNPKISVILPVYNVEDYLEETLNSLLKQTLIEDLEILMVDDGSTDNSRYIIEKYALDYDNFYAFHKENEGLAMTRNYGIEQANGEYIHFLDSDDVISLDGYEKLYELAIKNDSDIVTSNFTKFGRYNSWKDILSKNIFGNIDGDVDSTTLNEMWELVWDTISTNKIYKREFLNKHNLRFPDRRIVYEDIPFSLRAYIRAEKISAYYKIFYFWRVRKSSKLSLTQQRTNMTNFNDRIEIIRMCTDILDEENVHDGLRTIIYEKWLNHDFFLFLKKFDLFPEESLDIIIEKINYFLAIMPSEVWDNLNSYKKILYRMVEDNDVEGLKYLSSMNEELMENPHIPPKLDEKYVESIDFVNDAAKEDLVVKMSETIESDDNNIYLTITESVNYLTENHPHETSAALIGSEGEEHYLDIDKNIIAIPVDAIREFKHSNIKMTYAAEEFKKESFLQNSKRQIINYDGFDVEIGIQSNRIFCVDYRPTNDNEIKINEITFEDNILNFKGTSMEEIDTAFLQNVVTFRKIHYPVVSDKNGDEFAIEFSIPHEDILKYPVDKWELRVDKIFKSIQMPRRYEFYTQFNKIRIINARNKILIENDLYNKIERLHELYEEINDLTNDKKELRQNIRDLKKEKRELNKEKKKVIRENKKLNKQNDRLTKKNEKLQNKNDELNNRIEEYKSRFVVKSADKINHIIKRNE